ncbi:HET-domain-containing protein [Byssothecium circinans]|uniref:HET-domain-containing protein n=1 Tax=Byssothecium circinans TaxID=147558 RepID=A0A6A5U9M0_9PLEO|nr:HET-domain-containing protein [Byssothecium circinans]
MASQPNQPYPGDIASTLIEGQSHLQRVLAQGNLSTEQEIDFRETFASLLIQEYERGARGNVQYLRTAIEHYEAILRRLPQTTPKRPEYLTRLSYTWLSEYLATESRRALDEAVRTGRLALEEATLASLDKADIHLYREILNNCGVALSYRSEDTRVKVARSTSTGQGNEIGVTAEADLNESVECAKRLKHHTVGDLPAYTGAISNLSSRLMRQYAMTDNEADQAEAVQLIQELQRISQPGSKERAGAITLLSQLAVDKFNKKDTLENLDDALEQLKRAITGLTDSFERKPDVYKQTSNLYKHRYKKTQDEADFHLAVQYSESLLRTVPLSHSVFGTYLFNHLRLLREYANTVRSLPQVEKAVLTAGHYVANLRKDSIKQLDCRIVYGDILGRTYVLSQRLVDFSKAMEHIQQCGYSWNSETEKAGDRPSVDSQLIYSLASSARRLLQASASQTKDRGMQRIYEHILYAEASLARESLTDAQADVRADEAHAKNEKELQERLSRPQWKSSNYTTELGLRSLAIDPTNKRIVFDMRNLMEDIFGFDPSKTTMSHAEFVAKHQQIEADSVAKAKAKGQHPNPKLCYMCRYIKILKPTTAKSSTGTHSRPRFEWNDKLFLPFGNWSQLRLRTGCSICKLILSLIVSDQISNNLHPRLRAIDREIQGTQLNPVRLSTGETVLQVEYGMRPVGQLRMVSNLNYSQALRQGWEDGRRLQFALGKTPVYQSEMLQSLDVVLPQKESNQQINVGALRVWLKDCDSNHGEICNRSFRESTTDARPADDVPLILIDVVRLYLVESTSIEKYIALSYVWGKVDMLPTLTENFEARKEPGGLTGLPFPKTMSDAIQLVRSLGETYLWIDALCIVQDDKIQKARDIANMDAVYSKAFATVVAMHGTSAEAGLPGVGPKTRPPQEVETLVIKAGSEDLDYDPDASDDDNVAINLVATPPELHLALESSWWDSRGWTFQERLLSRRCIYFSQNYLYFQCGQRGRVLSECGINEQIPDEDDDDDEYEGPRRKAPIITALENPLYDLAPSLVDLPAESKRAETFRAYSKLVEKYTHRQLSYDSDIINAFLGTFKALETFQGQVLCGLPLPTLDLALLWTPCGRVPRRGHSLYVGAGALALPWLAGQEGRQRLGQGLVTNRGTILSVYGPSAVQTFDDSVDRQFPSWSWAGWKGSVEYRFFADALAKEPIPTPLVSEYAMVLDGEDGKELLIVKDRVQERKPIPESQSSAAPATAAHSTNTITAELGALNISDSQEQASSWSLTPTLPNVLQFRAPTVPLTAFSISPTHEYISVSSHIHATTNQAVRPILDRAGKRCGLWWEQAGYVYVGRGVSPEAEKKMMFVGISRCEDTFKAREGPKRVEGEIEIFDGGVYGKVGRGSGLVNVVAVDGDMGHEYAERVTVARIHVKAWEEAGPQMRMIRMA